MFLNSLPQTCYVDFVLIRHGETFWNESKEMQNPLNPSGPLVKGPLIQGASDIELNEQGEFQADKAAKLIKEKGLVFSKIVTSHLKRAAKTAGIVGQQIGLVATQDTRFSACSWGVCEGRTKEFRTKEFNYDNFGNFRGIHEEWQTIETNVRWNFTSIPEAETMQSVIERMKQAFISLVKEAKSGDCILVATHQENIKAFSLFCRKDLIEKLRLNSEFDRIKEMENPNILNCGLYKVRYDLTNETFNYLGAI